MVEHDLKKYCLFVDEMVGRHQIVIRACRNTSAGFVAYPVLRSWETADQHHIGYCRARKLDGGIIGRYQALMRIDEPNNRTVTKALGR